MDVIADSDKNRNGFFDRDEVKVVYDTFFIGIKDFDFFTEIIINGKKQIIKDVMDFNALIENDNTVSYQFVFPLNMKLEEPLKLKVKFSDRTIFVAFDRKIELLNKDKSNYQKAKSSNYEFYGVQIEFEVNQSENK